MKPLLSKHASVFIFLTLFSLAVAKSSNRMEQNSLNLSKVAEAFIKELEIPYLNHLSNIFEIMECFDFGKDIKSYILKEVSKLKFNSLQNVEIKHPILADAVEEKKFIGLLYLKHYPDFIDELKKPTIEIVNIKKAWQYVAHCYDFEKREKMCNEKITFQDIKSEEIKKLMFYMNIIIEGSFYAYSQPNEAFRVFIAKLDEKNKELKLKVYAEYLDNIRKDVSLKVRDTSSAQKVILSESEEINLCFFKKAGNVILSTFANWYELLVNIFSIMDIINSNDTLMNEKIGSTLAKVFKEK